MTARIIDFPTFDRGLSDAAHSAEPAAIDHHPDLVEVDRMLGARGDGPDEYHAERKRLAGGSATPAPLRTWWARMVRTAGTWLAEHWTALLLGGLAGMLGVAIPALVVARLLP